MLRAGRTPRELAQSLGVSEQTLRNWAPSGPGRSRRATMASRPRSVASCGVGSGSAFSQRRGVARVPGPNPATEAMVEAELIEAICFAAGRRCLAPWRSISPLA
jgi:hypothetical protein